MPKMMREVYYKEPVISVYGRYNREVGIDKALEIKKELIEKYGPLLYRIDIIYTRRKNGIEVKPYIYRTIEDVPCFFMNRKCLDSVEIHYFRYMKNPSAHYIVESDGSVKEYETRGQECDTIIFQTV